MEMRKKAIKGGAWALVLCVFLSLMAAGQNRSYAAERIRVEDLCSITFRLPVEGESGLPSGDADETYTGYYEELNRLLDTGSLTVDLYRVADVGADGRYTPAAGYEAMEEPLKNVGAKTTAAQWEEMAETAGEISQGQTPANAGDHTITSADMEIGGLPTGLYLVAAREVKTAAFKYNFVPFLISLPNNYYDPDRVGGSDAWIYDTVVGLKPERTDRYGSIQIEKNLNNYNERLGEGVFVFEITAVRDGRQVYGNVVSLTFDGTAASQSVVVDRIPADSVATVREVYGGASYELQSAVYSPDDGSGSIPVVADENQDGQDSQERRISGTASFTNGYNGGFTGGAGVENHFTYKNGTGNGESGNITPGQGEAGAGSGAAGTGGGWLWTKASELE